MPGELTAFAQKCALNIVFGRAADLAPPYTTYLALCTGTLTDLTTMSQVAAAEMTTSGYARQPITWAAATQANPAVIGNSGTVTFGPLTVDMTAPATYAALVSSASGTGGMYLAWWQLDLPMQVLAGQSLQVSASQITMSLT